VTVGGHVQCSVLVQTLSATERIPSQAMCVGRLTAVRSLACDRERSHSTSKARLHFYQSVSFNYSIGNLTERQSQTVFPLAM
jgi:hypothetical protein